MSTTFYFIRSSTDRNVFYRVSETGSRYTCECPDHTYRRRDCRHIEQVKRGCGLIAAPVCRPSVRAITKADVDELYGVPA